MQLDYSNLYLGKEGTGIRLCIEMPDQRNYLHTVSLPLSLALSYKQDLINQKTGNWNTEIIVDEAYFRVQTKLSVGEQLNGKNTETLTFHSRKLNLNDAEFDYFTLVNEDSEGIFVIRNKCPRCKKWTVDR